MLDDILYIAVIAATVTLISSLSIISGPRRATVAEATPVVQLPTVVVVGKREWASEHENAMLAGTACSCAMSKATVRPQ